MVGQSIQSKVELFKEMYCISPQALHVYKLYMLFLLKFPPAGFARDCVMFAFIVISFLIIFLYIFVLIILYLVTPFSRYFPCKKIHNFHIFFENNLYYLIIISKIQGTFGRNFRVTDNREKLSLDCKKITRGVKWIE